MHSNLFSRTFSVKIKEVPKNLQMEFVNFQCLSDLKKKYNNASLLEIRKKYMSKEKYQRVYRLAVFTLLFGTTYLCKQVFF